MEYRLSDSEFRNIQRFIFDAAGISMSEAKKALIAGRLTKRLRHYGLKSFKEYIDFVEGDREPSERQMMIDLLTTNETYFFREPKHFEFLQQQVLVNNKSNQFRVWSAASSSGEEAYTIAMLLADSLGPGRWEILGTDISTRVLEKARSGVYPLRETEKIPKKFLMDYCLKGVREQQGMFLIDKSLRKFINFRQMNLNGMIPGDVGNFDVIFLRNVMIYFNNDTKKHLVERLVSHLKPGGYFMIGHSETLQGIAKDNIRLVRPSIYQKIR